MSSSDIAGASESERLLEDCRRGHLGDIYEILESCGANKDKRNKILQEKGPMNYTALHYAASGKCNPK